MRSDSYYVQYIRGSLSWVASSAADFSAAGIEMYAPVWTWHIVDSDSRCNFHMFLVEA